jgi:hypothetical protein
LKRSTIALPRKPSSGLRCHPAKRGFFDGSRVFRRGDGAALISFRTFPRQHPALNSLKPPLGVG